MYPVNHMNFTNNPLRAKVDKMSARFLDSLAWMADQPIPKLSVEKQKQVLKFLFPKGEYKDPKITFTLMDKKKITVVEEADCCSESYFLPIDDLSPLLGQTIVNIDNCSNKYLVKKLEKRFPRKSIKKYFHSGNQYLRYHVYYITTKTQMLYFGSVNASNGYYDGFLVVK